MIPVASINALTARWISRLPDGATVCSGVGVWPLLAMLAEAAEGAARDQLAAACGSDPSTGTDSGLTVLRWLDESDACSAALGLWHRRELLLHPQWRSRFPDGVVEAFSGDRHADQAALDAWASSRTNGLIDRMPVQIDEATLLLMASALTVDTTWREPFRERRSPSQPLSRTTPDQSIVQVSPDVTCVRVEGENGIDVHLVLGEPDAATAVVLSGGFDVVTGATPATPGDRLDLDLAGHGVRVTMVDSARPEPRVSLTTPAFSVRAGHDLLKLPDVFGLGAVSDCRRGHLPAISDTPLCVAAAAQDAMAEFGEHGFRAATVTAMGMMTRMSMQSHGFRARQVEVVIDRPFGFLATHRETGLVLVAGWVTV